MLVGHEWSTDTLKPPWASRSSLLLTCLSMMAERVFSVATDRDLKNRKTLTASSLQLCAHGIYKLQFECIATW
jgi:hypothetical protein